MSNAAPDDGSPTHVNNLFGNRNDDPLLQDDPLPNGPHPEQPRSDKPRAQEPRSQDPPSERSQPNQSESDPAHPEGADATESQQNAPSNSPSENRPERERQASSAPDESGRMLLISQEAAAEGDLAPVNAALERGWKLQSVRLHPNPPSDTAAPPFAFHITRPPDDA